MNPKGTTIAKQYPSFCKNLEYLLLKPTDCKEEPKPCHKCKDNSKKAKQYKPV